jgi:hypothetical protein
MRRPAGRYLAIVLGLLGLGGLSVVALPTRSLAQQPALSTTDQAYVDWLLTHYRQQVAAVQAAPTSFDLGNLDWRREQVLALDTWGALIQQARDQRPPARLQGLHSELLESLDSLDQARRLLLVAIATGQEPGPEPAILLRQGQEKLQRAAEHARALAAGRPPNPPPVTLTRGDLRISVLGVTRPYLGRGAPRDPAWEYLVVRLRLENLGGEAIRYDALQFRLLAADETLLRPVSLALPDELLYGTLEGQRLAGSIVGNLAYPIRKGIAVAALLYEREAGEVWELPLAELVPPVGPAPTPAPSPTSQPGS